MKFIGITGSNCEQICNVDQDGMEHHGKGLGRLVTQFAYNILNDGTDHVRPTLNRNLSELTSTYFTLGISGQFV